MNWKAAEGRHGHAEVALQGAAGLDDVGHRPHGLRGFGPYGAVIAGVRLVQHGETRGMLFPVEVAAVDDHAADGSAVAADIFRRRIDDDRRAMVEGPADDGACGVVHDQWHAEFAADAGHFADGEHGEFRVGQGFRVVGAGALVGCLAEGFRVRGINETHFNSHGLEGMGEEIPGAAINVGGAYNVVTGLADVLHRQRGCGLA